MKERAEAIQSICETLSIGGIDKASAVASREYPFVPIAPMATRIFSEAQAFRVFVRDGFIDRYSGSHLLFPPVLRILTALLPAEFPFHRNWKMDKTHQAYWELFPTLDHVVPVARGGQNDEENLVSTSMLRNSAKGNSTLEELGWILHPPGDMTRWDGMMSWCLEFIGNNNELARDAYIGRWCRAAVTRRGQ